MECKEIKEIVLQYSFGGLKQVERASVENHLDNCAECRSFLSESKKLWSLLETWDEVEPDQEFVSKFWDQTSIDETNFKPGFLSWLGNIRPNWTLAGAVASIFLVSVITFSVFSPDTRNSLFMSADERDELILIELDNAISRETADVLSIYGPWDNGSDANGNGGIN